MNFLEAWLEELPVALCPVLNLEYSFRWKICSKLRARCGDSVFVVIVHVVDSIEN